MLRQIKYFQAVVRTGSFSEAAEECHISQSAVSQQIKALEAELGFRLLDRNNRKLALTPAGEYFYKKSLVLAADFARLCSNAARIARGDDAVLKLGYLRSFSGREFHLALNDFTEKLPDVSVRLLPGNHEELFDLLRGGGADLVMSDQRRAFSDEYVNLILKTDGVYVELPASNAMSRLSSVTAQELKNIPCILVASKGQRENEQEYYRSVIGLRSEFIYAENLEEARLLVISGQGFMPAEGGGANVAVAAVRRIPLFRDDRQITRNYCLFWKKDHTGAYIEEFAEILKSKFK
ncbi:MAG TPA: LysR family transcriptional regulator [Candidatus Monoglobus merdigallinarum]|uniref:LysR family transcriptional regulator n=1 Tax=Candidatus Monoglobus merdigallinarum TaxID=2838698 RepID=A0A9D1PNS9_9FIRM|nr:LysR family transcriptional regulator [Candidatus Monoglobus merdigallinarum]